MALSDILDKIQEEALVRADELKAEFETRKKALQTQNLEILKKLEEDNDRRTAAEAAGIKEKAQMEAEMEAKNSLLKARRELIENTLVKAVEALASAERYEDLLTEMMKKADLESAEVIPAKNKEESTAKAIAKSGKNYRLSSESGLFKGGFIIKSDKIEIDNSFETVITGQLKNMLEIELNKMFFV